MYQVCTIQHLCHNVGSWWIMGWDWWGWGKVIGVVTTLSVKLMECITRFWCRQENVKSKVWCQTSEQVEVWYWIRGADKVAGQAHTMWMLNNCWQGVLERHQGWQSGWHQVCQELLTCRRDPKKSKRWRIHDDWLRWWRDIHVDQWSVWHTPLLLKYQRIWICFFTSQHFQHARTIKQTTTSRDGGTSTRCGWQGHHCCVGDGSLRMVGQRRWRCKTVQVIYRQARNDKDAHGSQINPWFLVAILMQLCIQQACGERHKRKHKSQRLVLFLYKKTNRLWLVFIWFAYGLRWVFTRCTSRFQEMYFLRQALRWRSRMHGCLNLVSSGVGVGCSPPLLKTSQQYIVDPYHWGSLHCSLLLWGCQHVPYCLRAFCVPQRWVTTPLLLGSLVVISSQKETQGFYALAHCPQEYHQPPQIIFLPRCNAGFETKDGHIFPRYSQDTWWVWIQPACEEMQSCSIRWDQTVRGLQDIVGLRQRPQRICTRWG